MTQLENITTFGRWLKQLRFAHDLTQEHLAALMSCSLSTIRKLETGQRRPTEQFANQLAQQFDLPQEETRSLVHIIRTQQPGRSAGNKRIDPPLEVRETAPPSFKLNHSNADSRLRLLLDTTEKEKILAAIERTDYLRYLSDFLSKGHQMLGSRLYLNYDNPSLIRATTLHLAGALARCQCDFQQARMLHEQSLAIYNELTDSSGIANELDHLAWVAQAQGDYEQAFTLSSECLERFTQLGNKGGMASSLNHLGLVNLHWGKHEIAASLYQQSLKLARQVDDGYTVARAINNLGEVSRADGDFEQASVYYAESLRLSLVLKHSLGIAASLHNLGYVASHKHDFARSEALFSSSAELFQRLGDRQGSAECLVGMAGIATLQGALAEAADLLSGATTILDDIGSRLQPPDQVEYDNSLMLLYTSADEVSLPIFADENTV